MDEEYQEYHFRLGIFLSNLRYIQNFNRKKGLTFRLGINKFACYTQSEYKLLLGLNSNKNAQTKINYKRKFLGPPPLSFDWRDKNVVNPVKDQGQCGSGYAFSIISSAETCYALSEGSLLTFSEQNIIDCSLFSHGCNGGYPEDVYTYVLQAQNGQFNLESDYPYTGVKSTCQFDQSKGIGQITHFANVITDDENDLKERVAWHGVAVSCITANISPFMLYAGGILDNDSCVEGQKFDHCVAVVGYGVEDGIDFWIVRNSWGSSWGEDGYVRMIRNKRNQCGIASQSFVLLNYHL